MARTPEAPKFQPEQGGCRRSVATVVAPAIACFSTAVLSLSEFQHGKIALGVALGVISSIAASLGTLTTSIEVGTWLKSKGRSRRG